MISDPTLSPLPYRQHTLYIGDFLPAQALSSLQIIRYLAASAPIQFGQKHPKIYLTGPGLSENPEFQRLTAPFIEIIHQIPPQNPSIRVVVERNPLPENWSNASALLAQQENIPRIQIPSSINSRQWLNFQHLWLQIHWLESFWEQHQHTVFSL